MTLASCRCSSLTWIQWDRTHLFPCHTDTAALVACAAGAGSRVGVRLAIQSETAEARQAIAPALSFTGAGNAPALTRRQTVVRDRPTRAFTWGQRSKRSAPGATMGSEASRVSM